ncbi:MAG TPA: cytochrome P450 [Candidatus Acidoferrales bacterium]|nr:cytochrome P450 [Candidatus Acidoferrales bacterium]
MSGGHTVPPGPRGLPWLGVTFPLLRDPLGLLERLGREYGDVSCLRYWRGSRILLNSPETVEQVLVVQHQKFTKGILLQLVARRLLGRGLLTSEGELWRRQRRLAQPAFHKARIVGYAPVMVKLAGEHTADWRGGEERDLAAEMMQIALRIAVLTLFGMELKEEAVAVGEGLGAIMRRDLRRMRAPIKLPRKFPTPANRRAEQGYALLEGMVNRLIDEKRRNGSGLPGDDLLSRLMEAADEDGTRMSARQLRDETMTLLLAGHETTALTLAWTWYLLAQNPAAEARLHAEIDAVLRRRPPTADDLDRLPYLQAVVNESLRLYPPAYTIGRTSSEPIDLNGYHFPRDTTFLMSAWVAHRDPRHFSDPLAFRPERWLEAPAPHPFAYFPFGGGPRRCIGQPFALMEAALVIATVAARFRFRLAPGRGVVPEPLVTLRPKHGIRMRIEER